MFTAPSEKNIELLKNEWHLMLTVLAVLEVFG